MSPLPLRTTWAIAILLALLLHAGLLVALAGIASLFPTPPPKTEISFSVAPLPKAETATTAAATASAEPLAAAGRLAPEPAARAEAAPSAPALAPEPPAPALQPAKPEALPPETPQTLQAERTGTAEPVKPDALAPEAPAIAAPLRPERLAPAAPDVAPPAVAERLQPAAPERAATPPPSPALSPEPAERATSEPIGRLAAEPPAVSEPPAAVPAPLRPEAFSPVAPERVPPEVAERLQPAPSPALAPETPERAIVEHSGRLAAEPPVVAEPPAAASTPPAEILPPAAPDRLAATTAPIEALAPAGPPADADRIAPLAPEANASSSTSLAPTASAPAAEPLTPGTADRLAPEPTPEVPAAGAPDAGPAEHLAPLPGTAALAPVTPEAAPGPVDVATPAAPAERLGSERPTETASLFAPAAPGAALAVDPDKPTDLYRQAVDFVGGFDGGDCFVALPSVDAEGRIEFRAFARDTAEEQRFSVAYRTALGLDASINLGDIKQAQCAALSFARAFKRYPDFGLVLALLSTSISNGGTVAGSILGSRDRQLHLLFVDDDGRIQSGDTLLESKSRDRTDFTTEIHLTAGPVETQQLLLAVATPRPLASLDGTTDTTKAAEFFAALLASVNEHPGDIDIAIAGFRVVKAGADSTAQPKGRSSP